MTRSMNCIPCLWLLTFVVMVVILDHATALTILLTNEAGIEEAGLQKLRSALKKKRHKVYTFAPKTDMSGMGAALNMPEVTIEQHGPPSEKMWAVQGYPSTAVLVGLAKMEHEPDLIISGVNLGYASGPLDVHSGAVAGVLTGLGKDIPSFVVSTNLSEDIDDDAHLEHVADFTSHLVDVLVEQMVIFPIGVGLKIGYPALLPKDIPSAALAGYGHYNPYSYGYYVTGDPNVYRIGPAPSAQKFHDDADSVLVEQGHIGVLAITNDISLHMKEDNAYFLDDLGNVLSETDSRFEREARRHFRR